MGSSSPAGGWFATRRLVFQLSEAATPQAISRGRLGSIGGSCPASGQHRKVTPGQLGEGPRKQCALLKAFRGLISF